MLKSTFVSLVAGTILLEETARRDPVRIIDMQEFAVIPLFALV
jgi:hypothetical protein